VLEVSEEILPEIESVMIEFTVWTLTCNNYWSPDVGAVWMDSLSVMLERAV